MWPFKKKKIYEVAYKDYLLRCTFVELVKGTDVCDAWKKVSKMHQFEPISCESIQEVKE